MSRRRPIPVGGHRSRSALTVLADRDAAGSRTALTAPVANSHDLDRASNSRGTPPATSPNGFGRPELAGPQSARPTGCSRCPPGRGGSAAEPCGPARPGRAGTMKPAVTYSWCAPPEMSSSPVSGTTNVVDSPVGVVGHPGGPVRCRWTALASTSPWLRRGVGGRRPGRCPRPPGRSWPLPPGSSAARAGRPAARRRTGRCRG